MDISTPGRLAFLQLCYLLSVMQCLSSRIFVFKKCCLYKAHRSYLKQTGVVTLLGSSRHLVQVDCYRKLYCVTICSLNKHTEIQFISASLNAGTFISCEDVYNCGSHRQVCSACHSSLEVKDDSTTKRTFQVVILISIYCYTHKSLE